MRVLCAVLCLVAYSASQAAEQPLACKTSPLFIKDRPVVEDLATGKLPLPDYQDTAIACLTPPAYMGGAPVVDKGEPSSAWLDEERARYAAVLAKQPADILVVPMQIQSYGLDRIERAVMTADLAYAIGDSGKLRVADPFLTSLALGEGKRRIDPREVEALAIKIGARKMLFAYVGHDLAHKFTLTLQLRDTRFPGDPIRSADPSWQRDWRSVAFTNEKTPAYVLHEMLPAVLKELPLGLAPKARAATPLAPNPKRIAVSPSALVAAGAKSGSDVATLSLLATLLSPGIELPRERLFERALVAAVRAETARPAQRFLESYALFNLSRRPVALARIEGAPGASFDALRALLDGNLPAARAAVQNVKDPFEQMLLQIHLRDLEYKYKIEVPTSPTAVEVLFADGAAPTWDPLLLRRLEDGEVWYKERDYVFSIKRALDEAFPVQGFDLESIVRAGSVARGAEPDQVDIDLANIRHAHRVATTLAPASCCRTRDLQPGRWDVLWLLEGAALQRVDRPLWRKITLQAAPESALADIARYEPLLKGEPKITALSAAAALAMASKSPDDVRRNWQGRADQDARLAIRLAPGQNSASYQAAVVLGMPSGDSELWLDIYGYDFPRRPYWPVHFLGVLHPEGEAQRVALPLEGHAFSSNDFYSLDQLKGKARETARASLGSRFTGHPSKPDSPPPVVSPTAAADERIAIARTEAQRDPNQYWMLANYLFYSDRPLEEALDAFMQYPQFRARSARDAVELSIFAQEAGSMFFWLGRGDLAKPLFQIAADLHTGSESSMGSQQRLLQLTGDFREAAEVARQRVLRYSGSFAQRDYLSLLHAFGEHDAAWSAFSQWRTAQFEPALWASALVGHRMQKTDERALRAWLRTPEIRDAQVRAVRFAPYYALLWAATDRTPPADLAAFMEELEGKPVTFISPEGLVRRPHPTSTSNGIQLVRPTFRPEGVAAKPPAETPVKSEQVLFADAYTALVRGEYAKAVERFTTMATYYPVDRGPMPYFAYAISKAADTPKFEKYVMQPKPHDYQDFDRNLARAFFAAGRKQVDEAYRLLGVAFRAKPYQGERIVSAHYQFAQACEWLYRDTKDPRFAAMLLEWAKGHQSAQPTVAWGYAIQYQYEKDPDARNRALAMTLYLDPLSERIRTAPKADVEKARKWLATDNPFLMKKTPEDGDPKRRTAAVASVRH